MFARVGRIQGRPEQLDAAVSYLEEQIIGSERGLKNAYALIDRQSGKLMTLTLWETAPDLQATADLALDILREASRRAGASAEPVVETYEVVLTE